LKESDDDDDSEDSDVEKKSRASKREVKKKPKDDDYDYGSEGEEAMPFKRRGADDIPEMTVGHRRFGYKSKFLCKKKNKGESEDEFKTYDEEVDEKSLCDDHRSSVVAAPEAKSASGRCVAKRPPSAASSSKNFFLININANI
jgi:hypothetical protein